MRTALALLLLFSFAGYARSETASQRAQAEAIQYLGSCDRVAPEDRKPCKELQDMAVNDYVGAKAGDYQDQKNTAYRLRGEHDDGSFLPNRLQACAWYLVVIGSGHSQAKQSDAYMATEFCAPLDQTERSMAAARAAALENEIRTTPARKPRR